jgi:hypothetical protein
MSEHAALSSLLELSLLFICSSTIYDTTSEELTDAVLLHVSIVLAAIQLLLFSCGIGMPN